MGQYRDVGRKLRGADYRLQPVLRDWSIRRRNHKLLAEHHVADRDGDPIGIWNDHEKLECRRWIRFSGAEFGETVSLTVTWNSAISVFGPAGTGAANIQYSPDGGATWYNMAGVPSSAALTTPSISSSASIGVSNLNLLQIRAQGIGIVSGLAALSPDHEHHQHLRFDLESQRFGPVTTGCWHSSTNAIKECPHLFSRFADLYLAVCTRSFGYDNRQPTACRPAPVAIYRLLHDLVDGFYQVIAAPSTTTLSGLHFGTADRRGWWICHHTTGQADADIPSLAFSTDQYRQPISIADERMGNQSMGAAHNAAFPISAWAGTVAASTTAQ